MMQMRKNGRFLSYLGALGVAVVTAGMAMLACSKVDTVTPSDTLEGTQVSSCGSLDAVSAAQLATTRLEHFGTVGLAALAGLENSRAAARLLSAGDGSIIDPFIAESQSDLHDALVELRGKQLVASNVESVAGASVTFLLRPESVCEEEPTAFVPTTTPTASGGTTGAGGASAAAGAPTILDANCVKRHTENPTRIRISRIACDEGDNVAVEVLYGPTSQRLILGELYAERAELELNLGAYLRIATVTSSSSSVSPDGTYAESSTQRPLVSAAVGTLRGSLTLTSANQASGKISVSEAIDVTSADESASRIQLAAGTDLATISADGTAKTIKVTANLGAFDWRLRFEDFVQGFFGLSTNTATTAQNPVDIHVAGLRGSVSLNGTTDVIVAEGLDLGTAPATAIQGVQSLLSITATNDQHGAIAATLTGKANDSLGLALTAGLDVNIHYGMEQVMTALQSPANYLAKDSLTLTATAGTTLTLLSESTADDLAVTSSQTGPLLRVEAGAVTLSSSLWPSDTVTVGASQCASRTPTSTTGRNDLLDDFVIGACAQ